ncbi:MAG: hypothetical protein ACO3C9_06305, partial [Candidatus Nanopelagicales bacterium]
MKKYLKKSVFIVLLTSLLSTFAPSISNAITGNIPQPVIGTAQGFYAGKTYVPGFFELKRTRTARPIFD